MTTFHVTSVTPHGRRDVTLPMWCVELKAPGHRAITLYLTGPECADYGIDVPRLAVVR